MSVGGVLVFLQEFLGAAEGDLVDVAVDVAGVHADASVRHCQRASLFVNFDTHVQLTQLALELAEGGEGLQFLRGVDGVGHQLAQEYLMVAVQELLDDGEDVFGCYPNFSGCHNLLVLYILSLL